MTTLLERNALARLLDILDGSHAALQRENGELASVANLATSMLAATAICFA
jgi:hypothetical protein